MIEAAERTLIKVDVPAEFMTLTVPRGWTLEKWYKHETARLATMYPGPKLDSQEVDPDLADMLTAADSLAKLGKVKRQLVRLRIREQMEWGKVAVIGGVPIAERRQYHVREHPVRAYDVDAVVAR